MRHQSKCVTYHIYARLLTFNLYFDVSVAMVLVVHILLCSLASSHHFLVMSTVRLQLT